MDAGDQQSPRLQREPSCRSRFRALIATFQLPHLNGLCSLLILCSIPSYSRGLTYLLSMTNGIRSDLLSRKFAHFNILSAWWEIVELQMATHSGCASTSELCLSNWFKMCPEIEEPDFAAHDLSFRFSFRSPLYSGEKRWLRAVVGLTSTQSHCQGQKRTHNTRCISCTQTATLDMVRP